MPLPFTFQAYEADGNFTFRFYVITFIEPVGDVKVGDKFKEADFDLMSGDLSLYRGFKHQGAKVLDFKLGMLFEEL